MKNRNKYHLHIFFRGTILSLFFLFLSCNHTVIPHRETDYSLTIFPDYTGVTFPYNIAPLNYSIQEIGEEFLTEIGTEKQICITIRNRYPKVIIPIKAWKKLLKESAGDSILIRTTIKQQNQWVRFPDIVNYISDKPIDGWLAYRLLYPGYELWNEMGIYQRELSSYKEIPIIENREVEKGCVNCHSFCNNSPETFMLHIRGKAGGTLIKKGEETRKVDINPPGGHLPATYPAWHPGGRYIAFSTNDVQQFFHTSGSKAVEVSDTESDLVVWDTETDRIFTDPAINGEEWMETFPHWSPDGKWLYFCRSKAVTKETPLDEIRYDLCRISFDVSTQKWGKVECLYVASSEKKSVSFPRISPDGQYLMFTLSDYGTFSIWHPESDLYLLSMETGNIHRMEEVNSEHVDSYHSWSSSGDWFVFSSKRLDGLWAYPHIAFFDKQTGIASKPFILPQKDPEFYKLFTKTFNIPEFIQFPIKGNLNPVLPATDKDQRKNIRKVIFHRK